MPSDMTTHPQPSTFSNTLYATYAAARARGRVPGFDWGRRVAHWALRIPLAGLLFYYGIEKFPDAFLAPGDYGVPAMLFILSALAEVLGAVAIIAGGVVETIKPRNGLYRLIGDVLTRGGAFAGAAALLGVIIYFYWGALTVADLQVMALGLSIFLLFRGNAHGRKIST